MGAAPPSAVAVMRPAEAGYSRGTQPSEYRKAGSRGGSQGAEPSRAHATGGGLVFARHTAKRIPQGREPRGFSGGRAPLLSRRPHRATA